MKSISISKNEEVRRGDVDGDAGEAMLRRVAVVVKLYYPKRIKKRLTRLTSSAPECHTRVALRHHNAGGAAQVHQLIPLLCHHQLIIYSSLFILFLMDPSQRAQKILATLVPTDQTQTDTSTAPTTSYVTERLDLVPFKFQNTLFRSKAGRKLTSWLQQVSSLPMIHYIQPTQHPTNTIEPA